MKNKIDSNHIKKITINFNRTMFADMDILKKLLVFIKF